MILAILGLCGIGASGQQLQTGEGFKLEDYRIRDECTIYLVRRLRGGGSEGDYDEIVKVTTELTGLSGYVTLSSEPCMIDVDGSRNYTAKMPCGHVISKSS